MDAKLTRAELAERVDACTGVRKPVAQRTEQQKANLATILNVIRIPEGSLIGHLNWATWLFPRPGAAAAGRAQPVRQCRRPLPESRPTMPR